MTPVFFIAKKKIDSPKQVGLETDRDSQRAAGFLLLYRITVRSRTSPTYDLISGSSSGSKERSRKLFIAP